MQPLQPQLIFFSIPTAVMHVPHSINTTVYISQFCQLRETTMQVYLDSIKTRPIIYFFAKVLEEHPLICLSKLLTEPITVHWWQLPLPGFSTNGYTSVCSQNLLLPNHDGTNHDGASLSVSIFSLVFLSLCLLPLKANLNELGPHRFHIPIPKSTHVSHVNCIQFFYNFYLHTIY